MPKKREVPRDHLPADAWELTENDKEILKRIGLYFSLLSSRRVRNLALIGAAINTQSNQYEFDRYWKDHPERLKEVLKEE